MTPARNCFITDNKFYAIPGETTAFNYHVNPALTPFYPGCVLVPDPLNTTSNGSNFVVNQSVLPLAQVIPIDCTCENREPLKPDEETKQELLRQRQQLLALNQLTGGNGSVSPQLAAQYETQETEYFTLKRAMLEAYQQTGRFTDMEELFLLDFTEADQHGLLGAYFQSKDWEKARQLIQQLPENTPEAASYKSVMKINLAALPQNYTQGVSAADEAKLWEIADGETANRSYARGILALLQRAHFATDDPDLNGAQPLQAAGNTEELLFQRFFPNPAGELIQLNFTANELEKGGAYRLTDLAGKTVSLPTPVIRNVQLVELGSLPQGVYFL